MQLTSYVRLCDKAELSLLSSKQPTWTSPTGLQTTHINFTNALCMVQKWQCGVHFLGNGIIGPCFFENAEEHTVTLIADLYKVMLGTFLWNELLSHQLNLLWFQQDGALLTQHIFPYKSSIQCLQADSFFVLGTSPGPPPRLIWQSQTTSSEAMSQATYMKRVLPILMTYNSIFGNVFKDPWENATVFYDNLSIVPVGVYWMTC